MKKLITVCIVCVLLTAAVQANIVVEFSEVNLPNLTLLDGTTYFAPWGLSFEDTTYYAIDGRFPPAGDDYRGITTFSGTDNLMTVVFPEGTPWVTADWIIINSNSIYATAYDSFGDIVDAEFATGLNLSRGSLTLSGVADIAKITFHDSTGAIGVGRLEYIPEPATVAMLSIGAVCMFGNFRGRKSVIKMS
jgi:hypothetical protein